MRVPLFWTPVLLVTVLVPTPSLAQGTAADYERANGLRAKYEDLAVNGASDIVTSSTSNSRVRTMPPQRGCVTTSISAGSPRLTRSSPRAIAGARSFGSEIGPSPYKPYP